MMLKELLFKRNFFIGLAAVFQVLLTNKLYAIGPDLYLLLIVFSSTVSIYNFHKITERSAFKNIIHYIKHYREAIPDLLFILIPGVITLTGVFYFPGKASGLFILAGFLALNYSLVMFPSILSFRLKNIGWIKSIIVSLVWVIIVDIIPVLTVGKEINYLESGARFLFIYGITLPFDIRDMERDLIKGITTIPHYIGSRNAKIISCCCILISSFFIPFSLYHPFFYGWVFTALIACAIILNPIIRNKLIYYRGYLDGTLVLQYITVVLAHHLIQYFNNF